MTLLTILLLVSSAVFSAATQSMQLQPLPIMLPKPLFEGTPALPNVPNLEKPSSKPRPPFLAPAGTTNTNVALHKPVSGSDSDPVIGSLEMITDGNKAGTDGTYVELKPGVQNVVIDLKAKCTILAILIWHFHKEARAYTGVVAQVADDPDFITNVRTLFNNDTNNETGNGIGKEMRGPRRNLWVSWQDNRIGHAPISGWVGVVVPTCPPHTGRARLRKIASI